MDRPRTATAFFLVSGPMASGKSTVARLLAQAARAQTGYRAAPGATAAPSTARARWSVEQLHAAFASDTPRIGRWLDTSRHTPEQTVDAILRGSREAHVG